jgi:hypothetical protein
VLTESSPSSPGDPYLAFALALSSRAGIHATTRLRAALGSPLTNALHDLEAAESSDRVIGLSRLTQACAPISSTHQPPSPSEAAALRVVATALAGAAAGPGSDASDVLRTVAATVTVIENRSKDDAKTGESIILALV